MRVSKPKRGRRPAKRVDFTDIRELLRDQRQWTGIGVVSKPEDGGAHWEIVGDNADVMVEVVLMPDHVRLSARLAAGMWVVPSLGDEVAVILPAGELEFMPVITCILSHALPTAQGPNINRIVIARGEVLIHDGAGGAEALVKKSEYDGHTHGPGTFSNSGGAVAGLSGGAAEVTGTTVLKAK